VACGDDSLRCDPGVVALPAGDTPEPFVDAEDIADVVVAALTHRRTGQPDAAPSGAVNGSEDSIASRLLQVTAVDSPPAARQRRAPARRVLGGLAPASLGGPSAIAATWSVRRVGHHVVAEGAGSDRGRPGGG
jgi:hypothetical protein